MMMARPHDLVWLDNQAGLINATDLPDWVKSHWHSGLPLVVRRDTAQQHGLLPVGIRGTSRNQRAASWIEADKIVNCVTPEQIVADVIEHQLPLDIAYQPLLALSVLLQYPWPWRWGVTGGCGYFLATQINGISTSTINENSDLDLLVRYDKQPDKALFTPLMQLLPQLPCRVDIQLETPHGGCSLLEWYHRSKVLLKTNAGPLMVANPWLLTEELA